MATQSLPSQVQDLMNHESTVYAPETLLIGGLVRDVYVSIDKGFYLERNPDTDKSRWFTDGEKHEMAAQINKVFADCDKDLNFRRMKFLTDKTFSFYTSTASNGLSKNHKNSIEGELRISENTLPGEPGDTISIEDTNSHVPNTISLTRREAKALHGFLSKMLA